MLVFLFNILPCFVFLGMKMKKFIGIDEIGKNACVDVPGFRDTDMFFKLGIALFKPGYQNPVRKNHSGGFSPDSSGPSPGPDDPVGQVSNIPYGDVPLGDADKGKLIGDKVIDQPDPDALGFIGRNIQISFGNAAEIIQCLFDLAIGDPFLLMDPASVIPSFSSLFRKISRIRYTVSG